MIELDKAEENLSETAEADPYLCVEPESDPAEAKMPTGHTSSSRT